MARLGAERHTYANLVTALLDDVCDNAECAHTSNDHCQAGEHGKHHRADAPRPRLRLDTILKHERVDEANRRINAPKCRAEHGDRWSGIAARTRDELCVVREGRLLSCLLYTSDAADERSSVDL